MLLNMFVSGKERSGYLNSSAPPLIISRIINGLLHEKWTQNCSVFAHSRWEVLLKAIGQPLGTAKKVVQESHWEMPIGYWIASRLIFKGIGSRCKMPTAKKFFKHQWFLSI
jgi:hypothetical protein